ncbi:MAG: hypothetical protein HRU51_10010, partial [Xanthomonadales bacterium]|nr:hypothetical protein [Xanthomonadales bacterium]
MTMKSFALAALAALALIACQPDAPEQAPYDPAHDYYSYANSDAYVTEHLLLDLEVDFEARALIGTATLRLRTLQLGAPTVVLDTRDLVIEGARVGLQGGAREAVEFELGERHELLGQPLTVTL